VPALVAARRRRDRGGLGEDGGAVGTGERTLADDDERLPGGGERRAEIAVAGRDHGERVRAGAEIFMRIGEIRALADHADARPAHPPPLADAAVEDGGLAAWIAADKENDVGFLDPGNGRVEDVARTAVRRVERGA